MTGPDTDQGRIDLPPGLEFGKNKISPNGADLVDVPAIAYADSAAGRRHKMQGARNDADVLDPHHK